MVAYYSELLSSNMEALSRTNFLFPYLNVNSEKMLAKGLQNMFAEKMQIKIPVSEMRAAVKAGFSAYRAHMQAVLDAGADAISYARENGHRIMILAGRPYHIDPEISHGIDRLAASLGFVVLTEDSLHVPLPDDIRVLNQWTYHSRLYAAARYAGENPDVSLVQLVSFGCGIDAVTTDEVRRILEDAGALYTQIKIDEITNLGAVNIRLRSLLGALEMQKKDTVAFREMS